MILTESENDVENFFASQFGRDGIGGGSRGPRKLLGDNRDGHRGEGDDDDQPMEARSEERFKEPARERHGSGRV